MSRPSNQRNPLKQSTKQSERKDDSIPAWITRELYPNIIITEKHRIYSNKGPMTTPSQINSYFHTTLEPTFSHLIAKIVANRPQDIREFAIRYFEKCNQTHETQDSDEQPDRFIEVSPQEFKRQRESKWRDPLGSKWTRRVGVYPQAVQRKAISMKSNGSKDETTQIKLRFYFSSSFLFKDFNQNDIRSLIDSMALKKTRAGELLLREGDELGHCMYFVDSGVYQCSVQGKDNSGSIVLKHYQEGDAFAELCLLHEAKSQTNVVCKQDGTLYYLDREVYKNFKKMSIVKRRSIYLQNLKKVKILANLSKEDLEKLCDLLEETSYQSNEYVIHEGDFGTKFFIVIEGLLVAKKAQDDTLYQCYKQGDYFGQLALINNKSRQMSVLAVTKCKLVSLSSRVFLNVINLEKANIEISQKYKNGRPITMARKKKQPSSEYPEN